MNSKELNQKELSEALAEASRLVTVSCVNCEHFNMEGDGDICMLNGQRVPARIVVVGCLSFKRKTNG